MTDRRSYTVLEYELLSVERDALKAECEDLREAAKDCSGEDHQPYCRHYKRLKADNDRLRAELARVHAELHEADADADLGDDRAAELTELREAVLAYINAEDDDREEEFLAMEAVLAKVTS